jgi:hypothetical protein
MGAGNVHETMGESARVALSFLRAHGRWLRKRYGVRADPRRRFGRDYRFSIDPVNVGVSGYSAGVAAAGTLILT